MTMFAFLVGIRRAVRAFTRREATAGFVEGLGDFRGDVEAALGGADADPAGIKDLVRLALSGSAGAVADKPKGKRKAGDR
jgi:hypothetical protein